MMLRDRRGEPLTAADPVAVDRLEAATLDLVGFTGDPVGEARAALAIDPALPMAHALLAGTYALSLHPRLVTKARAHLDAGEAMTAANGRERLHLAAIRAWLDREPAHAAALYGRLLDDHPRDLLALFLAHQSDFFGGSPVMLAQRPAAALPHWAPDLPGYGQLLGMHAFGLEEEGEYAAAEALGRRAVDLDRHDVWAIHAVGHVMEMQGRDEEGIAWYTAREPDWAPGSFFAVHNAWHLALFHVDADDAAGALGVYDRLLAPSGRSIALNLADATALLWRLGLAGVDVGGRWDTLADLAQEQMAAGCHAFVDVHALLTLAGAGRGQELRRHLAELQRLAAGTGDYAARLSRIVLPVGAAAVAWLEHEWSGAATRLESARPAWAMMTGSHAQREILPLTLIEAAVRAGARSQARAMLEARLARKPASRAVARDLRRVRPSAAG